MASKITHWAHSAFGSGTREDVRISPTRLFAAVGALAIGAFSVAMGWVLGAWLETRMLERDAALSRDFVQSIANIQRITGFFVDPKGRPEPSVVEFFDHVAAMPDVLRANVYAPDRRVLWSSRAELIGQTFPANEELDEALHGEVVVNREDNQHNDGKAEHQGLDPARAEFVENYLPVFDDRSRRVIGVIELYRQPAALFAAIHDGKLRVWLGSAGGGLFLFVVLLGFVRRTERALETQQRRLIEAETLAQVGELSAAVAHSIRNPLVSIRTSAELQRELDGDAAGVFGEIMRNVDRIEQLVRTLLSLAAEPDRDTDCDLAGVLRDAAQRFGPELQAGDRRFAVELGGDIGRVAADPVMLAQVFNSLLANAAEATKPGGTVRLAARREGRQVRVTVGDDGVGIDRAQLDKVFRPFFTTKPRGMGLGLSLARRIVRRLGGDIEVASQPQAGTEVSVRLPVLR